jgi:hypothetical protein
VLNVRSFVFLPIILGALLFAAGCESDPSQLADDSATIASQAPLDKAVAEIEVPTPTSTPEPTPTPTPEPTLTPTPPSIEIRVPGDATLEVSSSGGASFSFAQPLVQGGTGELTTLCNPASGGLFPMGKTKVTCTATDGIQTEVGEFTVTVLDTLPPVLTVPNAVVTTTAFGATTATVHFPSPNGVDAAGGPITASCNPASGSPFPIGISLVTCRATDPSENEAVVTFSVEVIDAGVPREIASGCPASGKGTSFPPLPMLLKGTATLDGAPAPDGVLVFVRQSNTTVGVGLQTCDSDPAVVSNGQYPLLSFTPPEAIPSWFASVTFYVDGRPATASVNMTVNNYAGGDLVTVNLDAITR